MEQLRLTVEIEREGDAYSAVCPELGVASQGPSFLAAWQNFAEAMELYVETCLEQGVPLEVSPCPS